MSTTEVTIKASEINKMMTAIRGCLNTSKSSFDLADYDVCIEMLDLLGYYMCQYDAKLRKKITEANAGA